MSPVVMHLWSGAAPPAPAALDVHDQAGDGNSDLVLDQVVTLPANASGDVVYISMRLGTDGPSVATPTGWDRTYLQSTGAKTYLFRRVMDGTEAATVTFTADANTRSAWVAVSVRGAATTEATFDVVEVNLSESSPEATAPWGAAANLALAFLLSRTSDWEATAPSGYGSLVMGSTIVSTNSTRARVYGAHRAIATAAETPGAWTITSGLTNAPRAMTLIVRPA